MISMVIFQAVERKNEVEKLSGKLSTEEQEMTVRKAQVEDEPSTTTAITAATTITTITTPTRTRPRKRRVRRSLTGARP